MSAVYRLPVNVADTATFRVDASYRSSVFLDAENTAILEAPDNVLLNASVEYELGDSGFSVRGAVDNITGRQILSAGVDLRPAFGFVEGYYSQPRRYSLTLSYRH